MKTEDTGFASPIFTLVRTLEFDVKVGEHLVPIRIELYQNMADKYNFRCRMWEFETFKFLPTISGDDNTETIPLSNSFIVERTNLLSDSYSSFVAEDEDDAINRVLYDLMERVKKWSGTTDFLGVGQEN